MRKYFNLVAVEIWREARLQKRYWMNSFSSVATVYIMFLVVLFMGAAVSGQSVSAATKASTLVGMLMWSLSMGCMGVLGWSFSAESVTGTLEHLYLSPMGVTSVFLARSVANFLSGVVVAVVAGTLAMLTAGVTMHLPVLELLVIIPGAVAGTYGFGFLMAALTLRFKRTHQLMNLVQFFFMIFTGSMFPLDYLHWSVKAFGQTLPVTAGITALRRVTVDGASLSDIPGILGQMLITTVAWLAVGLLAYRVADRRARLKGSIGQY